MNAIELDEPLNTIERQDAAVAADINQLVWDLLHPAMEQHYPCMGSRLLVRVVNAAAKAAGDAYEWFDNDDE